MELLKTVALKNKANFDSILTWKGEAFEERTSTRGDWYDYMMKNKCTFAYDQLRDAVRWNKEPQEYRFTNHGESMVPILAFYNSTMIKDRTYFNYYGNEQPNDKSKIDYYLVIGDPALAKGEQDHCLDPRVFLTYPGGVTIHSRLMLLYNHANDKTEVGRSVKREGDLVILQFSDETRMSREVYDLSAGGNMVDYYSKSPTVEITMNYTYEEKSGVWILKSFKKQNINHRKNGEVSKWARTTNWTNSVVNVPFEEDEFTMEKLGVKQGARVSDHRIPRVYIYKGTLIESPLSPKTLIKEKLPDFKDLGINLSAVDVNDKKILVSFFDMEQRPSRNCILQLSKRLQELKSEDVIIAAIQAAKVEQAKLGEWIKENDITFAVGMIEGDSEKTRLEFGVKSLPWLILTDKNHVVTNEGFSLDELDEKIETLKAR
ncbi:MAG: redoxin domain-containing protein [Sedimentisphaerales bacterium]|nr:redoxin domain-containing protein [Sedimentisphaerales bacterium]